MISIAHRIQRAIEESGSQVKSATPDICCATPPFLTGSAHTWAIQIKEPLLFHVLLERYFILWDILKRLAQLRAKTCPVFLFR